MGWIEWIRLLAPYVIEVLKAVFGAHKTAVTALKEQGKLRA